MEFLSNEWYEAANQALQDVDIGNTDLSVAYVFGQSSHCIILTDGKASVSRAVESADVTLRQTKDVSNELRERGRQYLENRETKLAEARVAAGVSDDVAKIEGLTGEMLVLVGEAGVKSLDDLGDLASDELIEIVGEKALTEAVANDVIMAARAHWFEDDKPVVAEEAVAPGGRAETEQAQN